MKKRVFVVTWITFGVEEPNMADGVLLLARATRRGKGIGGGPGFDGGGSAASQVREHTTQVGTEHLGDMAEIRNTQATSPLPSTDEKGAEGERAATRGAGRARGAEPVGVGGGLCGQRGDTEPPTLCIRHGILPGQLLSKHVA
jgi:hypothetical protein